jgi:hypothetical protein
MKRVSLVLTIAFAAGLAAGFAAQPASAQTLKTIKDRGMLSCGVSQGLPGFSSPDDKGNWTGLDADFGEGPLHGVAIRRNRLAVAQHHLDAIARYGPWRQLHRRHLL